MNLRINKIWLWLIFILLAMPGVGFADDPEPLFNDISSIAAKDLRPDMKTTTLRERLVTVDFGLILRPADVQQGERLEVTSGMIVGKDKRSQKKKLLLNLFDDENLILNLERVENTSPDGNTISWFGRVEGLPESEVILINSDNVMSGNITLPGGRFFHIRFISEGVHAIREIDQTAFPPEAHPRVIEPPKTAPREPDTPPKSDPDTSGDSSSDPDEIYNIIDVMVVYTPAARTAAGGTTAMNTLIDLAVTETNQGYANSSITQRINLVHRAEVSYTETSSDAFDNALDDLTGTSDGQIDFIHTWRNTYKADMVSMFIDDSEWCGLGWVMYTESHDFEDSAFTIVAWNCATGNYSFAHEMGHNQGGKHDIAHSSEDGVFEYSHGYQDPSEDFRTIMAYDCPGGCTRVNYWSNTVVTYGGEAMGNTAKANMRRSHNNTYDTASNWRVRVTTVYVNRAWIGLELGIPSFPFNTITEGVKAITPSTQNGALWVTPGTYNESLTIDKPILFNNWGTGSILIE